MVVWLGWPRSAPGIPRSLRCAGSRPLTLREGGVCCCLVGRPRSAPGHPPLTALRWLAPPCAARRGRLLLLVWGFGCGGGVGCLGCAALPPPGIPRSVGGSVGCAGSRPLTLREGGVWSRGICSGIEADGCLVGVAPRRPGHPPLCWRFCGLRWLAPPYAARRGRLLVCFWGFGCGGCGGCLVWRPPLRPGHPPLTALRWLAPPYAARRGRLLLVVFLLVFQLILGSRVRGNDVGLSRE